MEKEEEIFLSVCLHIITPIYMIILKYKTIKVEEFVSMAMFTVRILEQDLRKT